ncbi:type II toxin-antitoxin system RelE/ParE family toxin [Actinomadura sp. KC345]|uniref:type II toxin-antitoxin system RelE family toxin n=1 Tax=Actinomadura sp. KC345 TaxID=2530371 RepID=UPI0014045E99|nr:type II toxin-antitoxin system RelE/ParE family toxin [Actinomadura sp. KC345]
MKVEWSLGAKRSAARFMRDQEGMRRLVDAVARLAEDPYPSEAFVRGEYHRLKVGPYRVMYLVEDQLVTVDYIDRVAGHDG